MPTYIIKAPNGQDVEMTSDKPPTEAQKAAIFKQAGLDEQSISISKPRTWTDTAVDALPAALGTAGAVIGGVGGSAFGMGVGGVPGAAGGAALGTGAGEAAKQLINRLRGAEAPATAGDAALEIGIPAAEAGVTTAALGGLGQLVGASRPIAAKALQSTGKVLASPMSLRRLAGKGIQAAGDALVETPKLSITATDYSRIRSLINQGISEKDAVRTILNLKAQALR